MRAHRTWLPRRHGSRQAYNAIIGPSARLALLLLLLLLVSIIITIIIITITIIIVWRSLGDSSARGPLRHVLKYTDVRLYNILNYIDIRYAFMYVYIYIYIYV